MKKRTVLQSVKRQMQMRLLLLLSSMEESEQRGEQRRGERERLVRGGTRHRARLAHGGIALLDTVVFESGRKLAHVLFEAGGGNWAAAAVELPRVENAAHVDALETHRTVGDAQRRFKRVFAWLHLKVLRGLEKKMFFFFFFFFPVVCRVFLSFFSLCFSSSYRITCRLDSGIDCGAQCVVVGGGAVVVRAVGTIRHTGRLKHLLVALARALRRVRHATRQRQNENGNRKTHCCVDFSRSIETIQQEVEEEM
jgi:hypothetical protein